MRESRDILTDLAGSGLSPDQLALVMELAVVVAAEARPIEDQSANRRREKDRERKRVVRRNPQTSAESADKTVSPTPPSESNPFPPLKGGTSPENTASPPEKPSAPAKSLNAWVSEIWEITPRPGRQRSGKRDLENSVRAAIRRGADPAGVKLGVEGYYASEDATKSAGQFAQGVHVVISSGRWEVFADDGASTPRQADPDPMPARVRAFHLNGYWHSDWGPKPEKQERAA